MEDQMANRKNKMKRQEKEKKEDEKKPTGKKAAMLAMIAECVPLPASARQPLMCFAVQTATPTGGGRSGPAPS